MTNKVNQNNQIINLVVIYSLIIALDGDKALIHRDDMLKVILRGRTTRMVRMMVMITMEHLRHFIYA